VTGVDPAPRVEATFLEGDAAALPLAAGAADVVLSVFGVIFAADAAAAVAEIAGRRPPAARDP
jgi:ubiquinone/menaquinone biosynthesis C-methylase UbiE